MKKLFLSAVTAFLLFTFLFAPSDEAFAQGLASVVYDFSAYPIQSGVNTKYALSQADVAGLLQRNPDGTFAIDASGSYYADKAAVNRFVASLASTYDVPGYTRLDQSTESQYLASLITLGINESSHTPAVSVINAGAQSAIEAQAAAQALAQAQQAQAAAQAQAEAEAKAKAEAEARAKAEAENKTKAEAKETAENNKKDNDKKSEPDAPIASTYIDINLTTQKLTYYIDGVSTLYTDIVTGNTSAHHDTPQGTYQIYGKQRSRTLRGADYEAYVNYWMPFVGNYGIHDATWRSSFGGSIYKSNGSHGCVNMPKSAAATLYETAPVGTVVYIHS